MSRGDYRKCKECGEYGWADEHRCRLRWEWRVDGRHDDDEWSMVYAASAEEAAQKATEKYDEGDHPLFDRGGREVEVYVKDPRSGAVTKWTGWGESMPTYHVSPAK